MRDIKKGTDLKEYSVDDLRGWLEQHPHDESDVTLSVREYLRDLAFVDNATIQIESAIAGVHIQTKEGRLN